MNSPDASSPIVVPTDVLAGIGTLTRGQACQMLALLESVDGIFLARGAASDLALRLGIDATTASERLTAAKAELDLSPLSVAMLRLRLWMRLSEALALPGTVPLSPKSAKVAAAGFAVRAAERLSPAARARRRKDPPPSEITGSIGEQAGKRAADFWKAAKKLTMSEPSLGFHQIAEEELLTVLAEESVVRAVEQHADPAIAAALRRGQVSARNALASGSLWIGGAAVVANAGFAPYMLAAQLSAFIPMVGGPALVSLLATLVNPATVFVGVATLGWLGMGKGSRIVRSQLAARLGVLLAVQGLQDREAALAQLLSAMRSLDREPSAAFAWLSKQERSKVRHRIAAVNAGLSGPMPPPAGKPPAPFDTPVVHSDLLDTVAVASLTAADMIWSAAALDPDVLQAADFSRAADLDNPLAFAATAHEFLNAGAAVSLRGYSAERLVINRLVADGHAVQLAKDSTTPGYDLFVDGFPVQVKCGTSLSILAEHFEKYPEIPVIADAALMAQAAASGQDWASLVTTLPGFELAEIEERIAVTLDKAAELAEPDILAAALSIGILRGGLEVARGRISASDLPAWLLLEGASRGALTMAGGQAGAWLGLITIGPAGALILGPAIGSAALLGTGRLKAVVENRLMADWLGELRNKAFVLHRNLTEATDRRVSELKKRRDAFSRTAPISDLAAWIERRASDDLVAAIEDRAAIMAMATATEADAIRLVLAAKNATPTDAAVLRAVRSVELALAGKPSLQNAMLQPGKPAIDGLRLRIQRLRRSQKN